MKILIYGAGVLGCNLARNLFRAGKDVPLLARGKWAEEFGNGAPVRVEIGMGKGRFIMDTARLHPEVNYVGIEKYSSVLLRAIQKMEE